MRSTAASRRRTRVNVTSSIDVAGSSIGSKPVNAFAGWVSPITNVDNQTIFSETEKFLTNSDLTYFTARSRQFSRDQEVTTWMVRSSIYLRYTPGGRAIVFHYHPIGDTYRLAVVDGVTEGTSSGQINELGPGTSATLYTFTLPDIFSIPGYSGSISSGNTWTVGAEGLEVYIKYNGTEVFRAYSLHCIQPGYVGLAGYGFQNVTATFKPNVSTHSDTYTKFFDIRDFGMKKLSAVGSMTGGSNTLTLVSNPGFAVGDQICVATGGEAGGGVPGERGVGGQWPTLIYANATAMNADTSQVQYKICGLLDTGATYKWSGTAWEAYTGILPYYQNKILPKALVATITNVSGTTITLDTAATVSTTNANVYFDNRAIFEEWLQDSTVSGAIFQPGCTFYYPSGSWVFSNLMMLFGTINGLTILGAGKESTTILTPPGTYEAGFFVAQSTGARVAHLGFIGSNRTDKGYIFRSNATTDNFTTGGWFVYMEACYDSVIEHIRSVNHSRAATQLAGCYNSTIRFVDLIHETGQADYFLWGVVVSDSFDCAMEDIYVDCDYLTKAVEDFRSHRTFIRRVTGRNAIIASNSGMDLTFDDIDMIYEANCVSGAPWNSGLVMGAMYPSNGEPLINLNTNIGDPSRNITFNNCDFEVQGSIYGAGDYINVINLSGDINNVVVNGKYPAKPVSAPSGLITLPDPGTGATRAIRCDSNDITLVVDGVRVVGGGTQPPIGAFNGSPQAATIIRTCVLDNLLPGGTQTNNITNAEYEAL